MAPFYNTNRRWNIIRCIRYGPFLEIPLEDGTLDGAVYA